MIISIYVPFQNKDFFQRGLAAQNPVGLLRSADDLADLTTVRHWKEGVWQEAWGGRGQLKGLTRGTMIPLVYSILNNIQWGFWVQLNATSDSSWKELRRRFGQHTRFTCGPKAHAQLWPIQYIEPIWATTALPDIFWFLYEKKKFIEDLHFCT